VKPVIRNSIFMGFFNLFGRASGFLRYILLVRFLSAESFALVTFAFYVGKLGRHFMDGGLDNFVSRDGARDHSKLPSFYVNALLMKAVLSVLFFGGCYFYLIRDSQLDGYKIFIIYTALLGSMMTSYTGVIRSCFTAIERMEYVFYTNMPSRIVSILLLFFALWYSLPLVAAVAAVSLENFLWFILLGTVSLRFFQLSKAHISFSLIRFMFWESLPLMVYAFFNVLYLSLDVLMIESLMSLDDVAPYTYASMLLEGVTLLLTSYFIAVYPTLSRLYMSDFSAYQKLFKQSFVALLAFTIPVSVMLGFWAELWMNIIKETGLVSAEIMRILAVNLNLSMMNTLLIIVFTSCNRQRILVLITAGAVFISFFSNWFMIHSFQQPGAAWASLFSQVCLFIIMSITASKLFQLHYSFKKPFLLAAVSTALAFLTTLIPVPALIQPGIFILLLPLMVHLFGIFTLDEFKHMMKSVRS